MWPNPDLVTFTEEILNGKLHFLCSVSLCSILIHFWSNILILYPLPPNTRKPKVLCCFQGCEVGIPKMAVQMIYQKW